MEEGILKHNAKASDSFRVCLSPQSSPRERGRRRIQPRSPRILSRARIICARQMRLSLSQRKRMKVRDRPALDPPVRTRLPATRCRALGEPGDSKIAAQRHHGGSGISTALDREFGLHDSYVLHRLIRWRALHSDNRNPKRKRRRDVGGEICSLQNFGSVSVAKECVQAQSASFAAIERDAQRFILTINASSQKPFCTRPSPQSSPRKRGEAKNQNRRCALRVKHLAGSSWLDLELDQTCGTLMDRESASPAVARNELLPVEGLFVAPKQIERRAGRFFPAQVIIHMPFP